MRQSVQGSIDFTLAADNPNNYLVLAGIVTKKSQQSNGLGLTKRWTK
jgi:hypothetical protein